MFLIRDQRKKFRTAPWLSDLSSCLNQMACLPADLDPLLGSQTCFHKCALRSQNSQVLKTMKTTEKVAINYLKCCFFDIKVDSL